MSADVWKRAEIDSPCIKVCVVHPETRLCIGCNRSIDEIARWSAMAPAERAAIMAELPGRPNRPARRGGRAGRTGRDTGGPDGTA
jgi:predicted Fe-S protein YdhL (DUF1289 family)